jgi:4,5-DOPA dioxygenase extradiol
MNSPSLPTLYISHGSPMTALEPREAGAFMQRLGPAIDALCSRPRAILAVSAHTLAPAPVLLAGAKHHAVYDFGGFPPELSTLRYDAPGAPALAVRVSELLAQAGMPAQQLDQGGLDHGIWTPLRYMFPDADVPVLPLAFVPSWSPAQLYAFGQALAPLTCEGVLIVGTGSLTHNLRMVFGGVPPAIDAPEVAQSAAFRAWVHARAVAGDVPALLDYRAQAPFAALMHPTDEHWLPWYPAWGAAVAADAANTPAQRIHASLTFGCLAMDAYAFGPQATPLLHAVGAH